MKLSHTRDEWLVGGGAFLVAVCAAFLNLPSLISQFLVDDSFYYLEIARNIALGKGVTFDGLHATNGFQPLYQFLIVPVFWLTAGNEAAIRVVKVLEAMLLAGGAVLLYRLVLRFVPQKAAAWLAMGILFLPGPHRHPFGKGLFTGMESGVNLVMILLLLPMWMDFLAGRSGTTFFFLYGLVIACVFLARLDNVFLIGVIAAHHLYLAAKSPPPKSSGLWISAAVVLVIAGSYLAWNYSQFGSIAPVSGQVQRWQSQQYSARLLSQGWYPWLREVLWFVFDFRPIAVLPWIGLLGLPAVFLLQRVGPRANTGNAPYESRTRLILFVLWVSSVFKIGYYAVFHLFPRSGNYWYYVQEVIVFALCVGLLADRLVSRYRDHSVDAAARLLVIGLMALSAIAILKTTPVFEWELASYSFTRVVDRYVAPGEVLGARDAGVLGYFLPNPVVNLDGLVNDRQFFDELTAGRIGQYVLDQDIVYLMNLAEPSQEDLITGWMGTDRVELVYRSNAPVDRPQGWIYKLYRVVK
jgi:hypothetical protein